MNDTHPKIAEKMKGLMRGKSGVERLMMGFSMYATARSLVIASLLSQKKIQNSSELRKAIFMRFYGCDFDDKTKERLLLRFN